MRLLVGHRRWVAVAVHVDRCPWRKLVRAGETTNAGEIAHEIDDEACELLSGRQIQSDSAVLPVFRGQSEQTQRIQAVSSSSCTLISIQEHIGVVDVAEAWSEKKTETLPRKEKQREIHFT
jgi:hypothetical protein